jgi:hypothetical protein
MSMTPSEDPESPVRRSDVFREQALQAWRGQEFESRVLLDLSPKWMRWALAGIFILAGVGVFLAATTTIPNRATSTASALLSADKDTVLVDAVFTVPRDASIRPGQTMWFRTHEPGSDPVVLTILAVEGYPSKAVSPTSAPPRVHDTGRILVHGAIPASRFEGGATTVSGLGGTASVLIGEESLLHLFRPRTPGGVKS